MTKGIALITVLIITSLLSFLAIGFAFIMVSENQISRAQELATQTHYLAEAGIQKAIWHLNNDWQKDFEDGNLDKDLKLNSELYSGDEIKIEAISISSGKAQIESKASYKNAERKIIVEVFKALGGIEEPLETRAVLTDQESLALFSEVDIDDDSLHVNTNLNLMFFSKVDVENIASADEINIDLTSDLYASEIIENAEVILMPGLDFDDYLQKADLIYSKEEFESLLPSNPVLSGIVYVTGSEFCVIDIERRQTLTINGFLLTDCAVHLADKGAFGYTNLIINNTEGQPSGLASKDWIVINPLTSQINISGLIYALGGVEIKGPISDFGLIGGLIAKKLFILNQLSKLNITYDENIIKTALGQAQDSPIISLEHWEEEY